MSHFDFTPSIRQALFAARDCALELRHEYVGTEHLLLGLVRSEESPAVATLGDLGISRHDVRTMVLGLVLVGNATNEAGSDLPYTSRSQKVIELAMIAAQERGDAAVSPIHLLLGLAREERGIGAQVLTQLGAGPAELLAAIDQGDGRERTDRTDSAVGPIDLAAPLNATDNVTAADQPGVPHMVARTTPSLVGIVVAVLVAIGALWILFR
ncbi:MAG: Clp protease N-terminal domain-containing protein [Gemmatimonadales bacterium]